MLAVNCYDYHYLNEAIVPNYLQELTYEDLNMNSPKLSIVAQPIDKFRFRYKSEKLSHGRITAAGNLKKSYPKVKLENVDPSNIVIKVSLVTDEENPKPHILGLVGKHCENDVCYADLSKDGTAEFKHLTIESKRKDEVTKLLMDRKHEEIRSKGLTFYSKKQLDREIQEELKQYNLNSAKLCFEAFYKNDRGNPLCEKIFSQAIFNQRTAIAEDLKITRLCTCSGKCSGNEEITLLCEKVKKDDIAVRFYEKDGDWSRFAEFSPSDVHYGYAITLKTPAFEKCEEAEVLIELVRPSDHKSGNPVCFKYTLDDDCDFQRKRRKGEDVNRNSRNVSTSLNFSTVARREDFCHNSARCSEESSSFSSRSTSYESSEKSSSNSPNSIPANTDNEISLWHDLDSQCGIEMENDVGDPLGKNFAPQNTDDPPHNYDLPIFEDLFLPEDCDFDAVRIQFTSMSLKDAKNTPEEQQTIKVPSDTTPKGLGNSLKVLQSEKNMLHDLQEDGNNLVHLAVMKGSPSLPFLIKIMAGIPLLAVNKKNHKRETPLHLATKKNYWKAVALFLVCGGDPTIQNGNGDSCLHLASKYNFHKVLEVLLALTKLEDHRNDFALDAFNHEGMTPLHLCIMNNSHDCLRLLINAGADVNLCERKCGKTALHMACCIDSPALKYLLKQRNIDVSAVDFKGNTPLHYAYRETEHLLNDNHLKAIDKETIIQMLLKVDGLNPVTEKDVFESAFSADSSDSESASINDLTSNPERTTRSGKDASLDDSSRLQMHVERKLCHFLDSDYYWRNLGAFIGMEKKELDFIGKIDKDLSPSKTILKKIQSLYQEHDIKSVLNNIFHEMKFQGALEIINLRSAAVSSSSV